MRKNVRLTRNRRKVSIGSDERIWIGIDVHKRNHHIAVWSDSRGLVGTSVVPADPRAVVSTLRSLGGQVAWTVYEAGPTGYGLVRALRAAGFHSDVIAPSKMKRAPYDEEKCDRLDCIELAEQAAKDNLRTVRVPTPQEEADRAVVRLRGQVMERLKQVKHQIKSFLLFHGLGEPSGLAGWSRRAVEELHSMSIGLELRFCLDAMLSELERETQQLRLVEEKIEELAQADRHASEVRILRSMPGVGLLTAMTFRTELLGPERFDDGREVAKMIGLAPRVFNSGDTVRRGRIMKTGNERLRTILVQAAWSWVRLDPAAREVYARLVSNTGSVKKAITAMARRMAVILWCMVTRKEEYRSAA